MHPPGNWSNSLKICSMSYVTSTEWQGRRDERKKSTVESVRELQERRDKLVQGACLSNPMRILMESTKFNKTEECERFEMIASLISS